MVEYKVLVVDDDPLIHDLIRDVLDSEPVAVLSAFTAGEGLQLIRRENPQIVFLDLRLPDLSGMDMLDKVMAESPGTNVVLMTGYSSIDTAVAAISKGAYDYFNKPVTGEKLRSAVRTLLEEDRRRQTGASTLRG